jgi:hypothetical protein
MLNKKAQKRLWLSLIIGFFIIGAGIVIALGSINPADERQIGYEFINDTTHIWNTHDDYYFNTSSGIQFTNHYDDYWSKNIFCLGYYNSTQSWVKIKCADELSNFNKDIQTDNLTYVNATLWKDFSYSSYDLRLGVRYNLNLNDENLSVVIDVKNIGIDIPYDLGFAWKIQNVDINYREGNDTIFINNTDYPLSGVYDLTFTNMSKFQTPMSGDYYKKIPSIRFYDYTKFLNLDWDSNLSYAVRMYSNGNQDDFYTMLIINGGHFNPNQEKFTTIYWIDATGDYTGIHKKTSSFGSGSPYGMTSNGTNILICDAVTDNVYMLDMNFTFISSWSLQGEMGTGITCYGITMNATSIWALYQIGDEVYEYSLAHGYTGRHFDTSGYTADPSGITNNGTDFFIGDNTNQYLYEFSMNSPYSHELSISIANISQGVTWTPNSLWTIYYKGPARNFSIVEAPANQVTFALTAENAATSFIHHGFNDTAGSVNYFYIGDEADDEVYLYKGYAIATEDTTYPIVNITFPINLTYYNYNISTLNYTFIETNPNSCWYTKNNGIVNSSKVSMATNWTNISSIDGMNNWTLFCDDTSGNVNSSSVSFYKNITYPSFSSYWDNNATLINSGIGYFNVTVYNTNGTVILHINGTDIEATNRSLSYYNVSISLTAGVYSYNWTAYGKGATPYLNTSNIRSYSVNYSYPIVNITFPINLTYYNYNISTLNYTFIETNPDSCWYSKNKGITNSSKVSMATNWTNISSVEGMNNWTLYCNNTSGKVNSSSVSFYKDTTYPTFNSYWDNNASLITAIFNVTVTNSNGTVWLSIDGINYTASNSTMNVYNVSVIGLSNGTYAYNWSSYGNGTSHNFNMSVTRSYTLNYTAPPRTYMMVFNSSYLLDDTYITTNDGIGHDGNSNLDTQLLNIFSRAGYDNSSILIKYNISMIRTLLPAGSNITSVFLNLTIQNNNLGAGKAINTTACLIENYTWLEETITYNNFNLNNINSSYCSKPITLSSGNTGMKSWNITAAFNKPYYLGLSNVSVFIGGNNEHEGLPVPSDSVFFNDKEASNISTYLIIFYNNGDIIPPTFVNQTIVNTRAGSTANFTLLVSDNLLLNEGGSYIFSTNNSGEWVNDTVVTFYNPLSQLIGTTKVLNSTIGLGIGYQWFINDTEGNKNSTPIYILTTTEYTEITSCQNLTEVGGKYLLMNNIIDSTARDCFHIKADNITLDCGGYLIDGTGVWDGINNYDYLGGEIGYSINSTIRNCKFTDWTSGINLRGSNYTNINNVNVSRSWENGIKLTKPAVNLYISNIISNNNGLGLNGAGIYTEYLNNSIITNVTTWDTAYPGLDITYASSNNQFSNIYTKNSTAVGIIFEFGSNNNTLTNMRAFNTPIGIYLSSVKNIQVTNAITNYNNFSYARGIWATSSSNINLTNISSKYNGLGFYSSSTCYNITIINSEFSNNTGGITASSTYNLIINNSIFKSNINNGIYLLNVANSYLNNLTISNNDYGILTMAYTGNNIFNALTITNNNEEGIYLGGAQNITIKNSFIINNSLYGISLNDGGAGSPVYNNSIYNNYFRNTNNTYINTLEYNSWNTTIGNYYYNYLGTGITEICWDGNFNGFCDSTYDMKTLSTTCSSDNCDYLAYSSSTIAQSYNPTTFEGSSETFSMNLTYGSSSTTIANAYLIYNGTSFSTIRGGVGNNITFTTSIAIPLVSTSGINLSFYWSIGVTNTSGTTYFDTYYNNQTVYKGTTLSIAENCSIGYLPALNFTSFWEADKTNINFSSVNYYLRYGLSGNSSMYSINNSLNNTKSFAICINSSQSYYNIGYGEIQYQINGASDRRYYIFGGTRITNTTINIPIYSLNSTLSTSFLITAQTTALKPYINYYVGLLRWYPEINSYQIVELGKTDDKGQTLLHVKTEDVDYRFAIYTSDGNLIKLFSPIRLVCQTTPCIYTLYVDTNPLDLTTWDNIESSLTFNKTTMRFTYIWNDPTQTTQTMNLSVWKDGTISSELICSTSSTGYTGVMICDVTGYTGTLRAEVTRHASPTTPIAQLIEKIGTTFIDAGGGTLGLLVGAILLILFAFIGVMSPTLVVILAVIALIPLYFLGSINAGVMMGIGVLGGIILHTLRRTT